ncbi:DUF5802 family protein [Halorussus halophilus]|uniref:DUF5802 family protein n=1 Tax=Halorussus halophilus TaxID=2650975 RepID=UPI001300F7B2|nr:DUF5802 family protein [Halorussus halophilus]
MFEDFSSGYYLGRLYVQPHDDERVVMRRDQHEHINRQLYTTGEGVERLDNPLVMKVDQHHLAVEGADDVPERTLVLPRSVLDDTGIRNPPKLKEVLLAKADRAAQMLRYQDCHPGVGT